MVESADFRDGVEMLLRDYLALSAGQSILCAYDDKLAEGALALIEIARELRIDAHAMAFGETAEPLLDAMGKHALTLLLEANVSHFPEQVVGFLAAHTDVRAYRFFGARPEAIAAGFRRKKDYLRRLNLALIHRLHASRTLRIESDLGTMLTVELDGETGWINSYGDMCGRNPGTLPPSEVNTASTRAHGVLVVDGAVQANIAWPLDSRLGDAPLRLRLDNGVVAEISGATPLVCELVGEVLGATKLNEQLEIGIGTNDGLREFLAEDSLLNERFPAFHLGIGRAGLHIDFILHRCRVFAGAELVLEDGRFMLDLDAPAPTVANAPRIVSLSDAI